MVQVGDVYENIRKRYVMGLTRRNEMKNIADRKIFQILPNGFFNLLAGGSNQEIYSDCLLLIYDQFEREISYRVDRKQIRDQQVKNN